MSHFLRPPDIILNTFYINSSHHPNRSVTISVPVAMASPSLPYPQSSCAKTFCTVCCTMIYINVHTRTHARTHTHTHTPFNGPLSRTTQVSKSAPSSRQITTPAPHHSFLQAGCPSCRPTNSVKALKAKLLLHNYIY